MSFPSSYDYQGKNNLAATSDQVDRLAAMPPLPKKGFLDSLPDLRIGRASNFNWDDRNIDLPLQETSSVQITSQKASMETPAVNLTQDEIARQIIDAGNELNSAQAAFFTINNEAFDPTNYTDVEAAQLNVLEIASEISKGTIIDEDDQTVKMTDEELLDSFVELNYALANMQGQISVLPKEERAEATNGLLNALVKLANLDKYKGKSEGNLVLQAFINELVIDRKISRFPLDEFEARLAIARDPSLAKDRDAILKNSNALSQQIAIRRNPSLATALVVSPTSVTSQKYPVDLSSFSLLKNSLKIKENSPEFQQMDLKAKGPSRARGLLTTIGKTIGAVVLTLGVALAIRYSGQFLFASQGPVRVIDSNSDAVQNWGGTVCLIDPTAQYSPLTTFTPFNLTQFEAPKTQFDFNEESFNATVLDDSNQCEICEDDIVNNNAIPEAEVCLNEASVNGTATSPALPRINMDAETPENGFSPAEVAPLNATTALNLTESESSRINLEDAETPASTVSQNAEEPLVVLTVQNSPSQQGGTPVDRARVVSAPVTPIDLDQDQADVSVADSEPSLSNSPSGVGPRVTLNQLAGQRVTERSGRSFQN